MKYIVITGVSSGIGFDTTRILIENGFFVFGSVRRSEDADRLKNKFGGIENIKLKQIDSPLTTMIFRIDDTMFIGPHFHKKPSKSTVTLELDKNGWMFEEYEYLWPMKEAAEILAAYDGWPLLYDATVLQKNTVPCAAAVYYNDMYVERTFSEEMAQKIRGIRLWVTNEYEHNALRADGERVLGRLLDMLYGEV